MIKSPDKNGKIDPPVQKILNNVQTEKTIVPLTFINDFVFDERLYDLKDWVLVDYCEYGANDWDRKETHIWGYNTEGTQVCMNKTIFDMVKPLVESQKYINSFNVWKGEKIDVDLDIIRNQLFVNLPYGAIQTWLMFAFPDMDADISKPWIDIKPSDKYKNKIILNFTERYRNTMIDYFFLKDYENDLVFTGTENEHKKFCSMWNLDVPKIELNDFLELAQYIKGCRFLLGNQSSEWNLATAIGTPRLLEVCQFAPNCQPFVGEDNLGFLHKNGLIYHFEYLYEKTK